jgi:hypothetical protein
MITVETNQVDENGCDKNYSNFVYESYEKLIIKTIEKVHSLNKESYGKYDNLTKTNERECVLQDFFPSLGILRSYTSVDPFLVKYSSLLSPFSFGEKMMSELKDSDITTLNEQICHLLNSSSQNCRKGLTLMLNESFINSATVDLETHETINLSAEDYSRFIQAEIFIAVEKELGLIIIDHTDIQNPKVITFYCLENSDDQSSPNPITGALPFESSLRVKYLQPLYRKLKRILNSVFRRDPYRLNALVDDNEVTFWPYIRISNENRIQRIFVFTTLVSVLCQGNPWTIEMGKNKDVIIFDKYVDWSYVDHGTQIYFTTAQTYHIYLVSLIETKLPLIEKLFNDHFVSTDKNLISINGLFSQLMAILGHFMCFQKSIFSLTGLGYQYKKSSQYQTVITPTIFLESFAMGLIVDDPHSNQDYYWCDQDQDDFNKDVTDNK